MKKITLLLTTLIFSLTMMFSSPSYAKWTKVGTNDIGDTFYVDFERIKKHGGYVYFWRLDDYLKQDYVGNLSAETYFQGDCKLFRNKGLSFSTHTEPMGEGTSSRTYTPPNKWHYLPPNSPAETILKKVCEYAN